MRDLGMELRGLAAEESAAAAHAVDVADVVARRAGSRRLVKRSALGAGSALAVGVLAVGGVMQAVRGDLGPLAVPASPYASEALVPVSIVPNAVENEFNFMTPLPSCEEPRDFGPRSAHGLTLTLNSAPHPTDPSNHRFNVAIEYRGDEDLTFIASGGAVVLVQDDVVVSDPTAQLGALNAYSVAPESREARLGWAAPSYWSTCDGATAWDDLTSSQPRGGNGLTGGDQAEFDSALDELMRRPLDPGEYTAYAWTPVVFGESAAAARAWAEAGFDDLHSLSYPDWHGSPLYGNHDMSKYCTTFFIVPATGEAITVEGLFGDNIATRGPVIDGDQSEFDGMFCDVPAAVLEVELERMVPESYINDYETTYLVSEPITFTVE